MKRSFMGILLSAAQSTLPGSKPWAWPPGTASTRADNSSHPRRAVQPVIGMAHPPVCPRYFNRSGARLDPWQAAAAGIWQHGGRSGRRPPTLPNPHAIVVLIVTVLVFYLYTRRWIRMELVSLLLLAALLSIFYLFPYVSSQARITETVILQSFGHPALVAICSLMVLGRGLTMTGALEPVVRILAKVWALNRWLGLLLTLILAAGASGFINDTPVMVLMLPMLLSLAERTGYPASKTLMPVNFAVLIGGMLTVMGTSTNILVLSIATDLGMQPMGIFDFSSISVIALLVALPYLWLIAPALLPDTSGG
ncbi:MAG: hypothetical protein FJ170_04255, partial [Gammaproteobacteria bacterium]|nr:hypothetical protein [Gammaproteobacteria bacterium]